MIRPGSWSQSEMVANETVPTASADPGWRPRSSEPLEAEEQLVEGNRAMLLHHTRLQPAPDGRRSATT